MTSHAFNQLGLPEPPPREQERSRTLGANAPKAAPPPYQSLITIGPATRASGKQAGKGQVSAAPSGAAGSRAGRFPVVAAPSLTALPGEAPVEVASPARAALSFRKVIWS